MVGWIGVVVVGGVFGLGGGGRFIIDGGIDVYVLSNNVFVNRGKFFIFYF